MDRYLDDIFILYIEKYWQEAMDAGEPFVLEEDNDGGHGTRTRTNIVQERRQAIDHYANPPVSPDMSIIERVWRVLKQRMKRRKPTTIDEMEQALKEEWDAIPMEYINRLVKEMPERVKELRTRQGLSTRY